MPNSNPNPPGERAGMVEAVAEAVWDAEWGDGDYDSLHPNSIERGMANQMAAAAIAAMPDERAAIVTWLRELSIVHRSKWALSVDRRVANLADAIERGDHLTALSEGSE